MVAAIPFRATSASAADTADRVRYLSRWMRVWLAVLVATTLVVVAYLVLIGIALQGVSDNLGTALHQVRSVQADVNALPQQVGTVNSSLRDIAANVSPLPHNLDVTNSSLASVDRDLSGTTRSLAAIDGALGDTTTLLHTTTGRLTTIGSSLTHTSGTLQSVAVSTRRITAALRQIDDPADGHGARDVYTRVARINALLDAAHTDTGNILAALGNVDRHLTSICRSPLLYAAGVAPPC